MSETIEVGFVECAESQISREDLAKKLEETADKLRCGFIKSVSVAIDLDPEVELNSTPLKTPFNLYGN